MRKRQPETSCMFHVPFASRVQQSPTYTNWNHASVGSGASLRGARYANGLGANGSAGRSRAHNCHQGGPVQLPWGRRAIEPGLAADPNRP